VILRALLVCLLSGCAAWDLSEADCRGMDWAERGERDGYGGHPPQDLTLASRCARHGVAIAHSEYLEAWARGHDEHMRLKTMNCD
jgi:hypothetical protein